MKKLIIYLCLIFVSSATVAVAQDGDNTRSITSDDFAKARPAASSNSGPRRSSVKYNLVRRDKKQIRWKSTKAVVKRPQPKGKMISNDIGITIWKMRRALAVDAGVLLPVKVGSSVEMWSSVRVDPLSPFKAGDLIRLAVESPATGYLYVINSEISSDGSYGDPSLIFPAPANQYNSVTAGMLVDIPDQKEPFPYFKLEPKKGNYAGELVAVVITPVKLNFQVDEKGKILNIGSVIDLNLGIDVQVFGSTSTTEQLYTQAEADSSCGSKSRELVRVKQEQSPCGTTSRSLTRDEPLPQAIYRVNTYRGRPAVALIELRTAN